jgi:hypothetical protein
MVKFAPARFILTSLLFLGALAILACDDTNLAADPGQEQDRETFDASQSPAEPLQETISELELTAEPDPSMITEEETPSAASVGSLRTPVAVASQEPPTPRPILPNESAAREIVVVPNTSINAVIEAALPGARILVKAGVYPEQVRITKAVTLEGEPGATIDGECTKSYGVVIAQERLDTGQPRYADLSNIVIRGFVIRQTVEAGIQIQHDESLPQSSAPHDISIENNTITDFNCRKLPEHQYRAGVADWYAGRAVSITGNTIVFRSALGLDHPDQRWFSNGIWFKSNDRNPSGGGHYIANNRIIGGWDGIGGEVEASAHGSFDRDSVIERNVVSNCWDDGIQSEGGTQNVVIRFNEITLCGTGIALSVPRSGPQYVEDNRIHSPRPGREDNNFCFKVGGVAGGVTYLTRNRCEAGSVAGFDGIKQTDGGLAPIVARNNCFLVSRYIYEITYGPAGALDFDGNTFSTTDGDRFIKWGEARFASLAAFSGATGQERNGRQASSC